MQIAGDIITRNMDWPGAEEIANRMKLMLPPPIAQSIQAEEGHADPKILAAVAPLQMQLQQMQQAMQEMQAELQKRDLEKAKLQTEIYKAETERIQAQQGRPEDNTAAIRAMELEYEDRWKKLEADKDVVIAGIQANASAQAPVAPAAARSTRTDRPGHFRRPRCSNRGLYRCARAATGAARGAVPP
jgi:hypothetical protein